MNIVCWRFWAFACASGCFVAWRLVLRWYVSFMPLFARFVRGFVGFLLLFVILLLSGGCWLCVCCVRRFLRFVRLFLTAVCVFQRFCVNWCFSYCLLSFACLDGLFYLICLSLPLITHFLYFFDVFFVRFESCLSFFRIACWVLHGLAACFALCFFFYR